MNNNKTTEQLNKRWDLRLIKK